MDEEIDRLVVSVRADTAAFARDVSAMRGELEGPLVAGAGRAGRMIDNALAKAITTGKVGFDDLKRVALSAMAEIAQASLRSLFNSSGGAGSGSFGAGLLNGLGQPDHWVARFAWPSNRRTRECRAGLCRRRARTGVVRAVKRWPDRTAIEWRIARGARGHRDSGAGAVRPASAAAIEPPSRPGDPLCAGGAAMKHWFTSPGRDRSCRRTSSVSIRFTGRSTFPRGTIASVVTTADRARGRRTGRVSSQGRSCRAHLRERGPARPPGSCARNEPRLFEMRSQFSLAVDRRHCARPSRTGRR